MVKTKITEIKTTIMNTLLGDSKIIELFKNKDIKKVTEYVNKNVYPYLSGDHLLYNSDNYIYFDVDEDKQRYKLVFELKSHEDINVGTTCSIDKLVEYIQEAITNSYPMCNDIRIAPSVHRWRFITKRMSFYLYK